MLGRKVCVVKTLENPDLNGILLGLELADSQIKMRTELFPCCLGSGQFEITQMIQNQQITGQSGRCSLKFRLNQTLEILKSYHRTWGTEAMAPHQLGQDHSSKVIRQVAETLKGYRPQATILYGKKSQPSEIWAMALACSWRFGYQVHIIRPQKNFANLQPALFKAEGPMAIFIEKVDRLWDPTYVDIFESLVAFAYNANAPLWIELCRENQPVRAHVMQTADVSSMIQRRLQKARNVSPMEFLSSDCLSRLRSMCTLPRTFYDGVDL